MEENNQNNDTPEANPTPDVDSVAENEEWGSAIEEFKTDNNIDLDLSDDNDDDNDDKQDDDLEEPDKGDKEEIKEDEPDTPDTPEKTPEKDDEKDTPEKKEEEDPEPQPEPEPEVDESLSVREQRNIQRELEADEKAMKEDIREKMFEDVQTELTDADGDPIKSIEDVQKLMNPKTGKAFTPEEAATWLLQAQQHQERQIKEMNQKVEQVAEVNLTLKDQADTVRDKYGELLEANPNGIRERIWEEYKKTLVRDENSGIIIDAPVSLENFYETALTPYMKMAEQLKQQEQQKQQAEQKAQQEKKKKQLKTKKKRERNDREDIYSSGQSDSMDPEAREWQEAAEEYYEQ